MKYIQSKQEISIISFQRNKYIQSKQEKIDITIEFCTFELILAQNFNSNLRFWYFQPNLPKGTSSIEKIKIEHHHWILHIRISLATKFQIKLRILIFWTKFVQKLCIYGQHRKMWTPPLHYAYSNYPEYRISLDTNNSEFWD